MAGKAKQPNDELMFAIADYCTLRVIDALSKGEMRFSEIHRELCDATTVTLTNRLKKLESLDLIERRVETLDKQSVTYCLTDTGKKVLPIVSEFHKLSESLNGAGLDNLKATTK
jgi:DNA-binding HxlR family transcriptional regulator